MLIFAVGTKIFGGLANIWGGGGCASRPQRRTVPALTFSDSSPISLFRIYRIVVLYFQVWIHLLV